MGNETNLDKDVRVAKAARDVIIETADVVLEAVTDHVSGLLNG